MRILRKENYLCTALAMTRFGSTSQLSTKEILVRLKTQYRQNTNEIKNESEDRNV